MCFIEVLDNFVLEISAGIFEVFDSTCSSSCNIYRTFTFYVYIFLTQFRSVQFAVVLHHGGVSVVQFVHRPLQLCDGPEEAPWHLAQRRQQEGVERAHQEEHGGADQEEGGGRG